MFQLKQRVLEMIGQLPRAGRVFRLLETIFANEFIVAFSWAGRGMRLSPDGDMVPLYAFESTFVERVVSEILANCHYSGDQLRAQGALKNHFKNLNGRLQRRRAPDADAPDADAPDADAPDADMDIGDDVDNNQVRKKLFNIY